MLTALIAVVAARAAFAIYRKRGANRMGRKTDPAGSAALVEPVDAGTNLSANAMAFLIVFVLVIAAALPAAAQNGRSTGVGIQLGSPSGVSVKLMRANEPHFDFLAAWDLGDFLYLTGHAVWEKKVDDEIAGDLRMFYGPGAFIGFRDGGNSNVILGVSGAIGASLWYNAFEFFIQLTPRFELAPRTDFGVGGGIGARFHFARG